MIALEQSLVDIRHLQHNIAYNKIARIHKYWSRKPWHVIQHYILQYSRPQSVVLDPFCGSGSVSLECVLNNRQFIGYDLNPVAIFITENILSLDFDSALFDQEMAILTSALKAQIMDLYKIEQSYILYLIKGKKNSKNYNCVTGDFQFEHKCNITLPDELINQKFTMPSDLTFPDKTFPTKFYKDRFSYKGVQNVSDFFSSRNLIALAMLYNFIQQSDFYYKNLLILAFSNTLLHVSKLKAENVRPLSVNNFWIPDDFIEENVWWRFADRVQNLKIAKQLIHQRQRAKNIETTQFQLFNKSSLELAEIADASIDYLITDPPYGEAIQYSELSFIWNCWLQQDYDIQNEVIINPVQNKGLKEFHSQVETFIKHAKRVLKKDAFFTLCFQNKEVKIWLGIIQSIKNYGFVLHDVKIFDTFGTPYNKHWAKFSPKSDLYVTFKNTDSTYPQPTETIESSQIISQISQNFEHKPFDLYKGYDLFVASVIQQIFDNKLIAEADKLDLKGIITLFEQEQAHGTLPKRHSDYLQGQFFV